jgi:4-deoxy-L-threo-5-hexosulose-uronate ketol-isomerase
MMERVSNDELRDRYLVGGMFVEGEVNLNYSHNERFVIGGAVPSRPETARPDRAGLRRRPPVSGRREAGIVNIGTPGAITVDGQRFENWAIRNASMCPWAAPKCCSR